MQSEDQFRAYFQNKTKRKKEQFRTAKWRNCDKSFRNDQIPKNEFDDDDAIKTRHELRRVLP